MKIPITFFAPAERKPIDVVQRQAEHLGEAPLALTFLNGALNYLLVLNAQRQIVIAGENVLELVPDKSMDQIVGLRPGEALGCVHAYVCKSGCGTSRFCRQCGAVKVILKGLGGCQDMQECHLTRSINGRQEILHLQVLATPLEYSKERYTLLAVAEISHRQRRRSG